MEQRDVAALRAAITVAEGEAEADGAVVEVSGGSAGRHTWQPLSKLHTFYTLYTPHPTPTHHANTSQPQPLTGATNRE